MKVLSFIGSVFVMALTVSLFRACQNDRIRQQQIERASVVTTVWIPHPAVGRMIPYYNAEVLKQGVGYIQFRTTAGAVIEHSGQYQVQTAARQ